MLKGASRHGAAWPLIVVLILVSAGLWVLSTGTVHLHELLVGAVVVVLSTLFLRQVFLEELGRFSFTAADLLSAWHIPWYVLSSSSEIVMVLLKDLFGGPRASSIYRVCGFQTSRDDPRMVARRALAIGYTSFSPNFIIVGIDYHLSRMLFHQLQRSTIPDMTKQLGARVSKDPSRHAGSQEGGRR